MPADIINRLSSKNSVTELAMSINRTCQKRINEYTPVNDECFFILNTKMNKIINNVKYAAPANPYKPIKIEASDIQYRNKNTPSPIYGGLGQVRKGDWDKTKYNELLDEDHRIKGIRQRFKQGMDWEETIYYEVLRNKNHSSNALKNQGYCNINDYIKDRLEYIDDLFSDIQEGYKTSTTDPRWNGNIGIRESLEILVTIGNDGNIYLWDGHHRLGIAKVLGLKIPAHVVCRHENWQSVRDRTHTSNSTSIQNWTSNHPDLIDLTHDVEY